MRAAAMFGVLIFLLFSLGGGHPAQADEPGDRAREKAVAEMLAILRVRMEARVKEGEALAAAGRLEEALEAYRSVAKISRDGLDEIRKRLGGTLTAKPAGAESPAVAPESPAAEQAGFLSLGGTHGAFNRRSGAGDRVPRWAQDRIDDALRWLAAHQSPNGGWEAAGFQRWCNAKPVTAATAMPDGLGKALYDPGVTGLALCAFLGAGYSHRGKHPFSKTVSRGLRYLKNIQDPAGCFGPRNTQQYVYNHMVASLAMVEAFGMTGSPVLKGSAQRSLDFTCLCRNPYFAWRYGVKPGDNDTSVTAWAMQSITSAYLINAAAVRAGRSKLLHVDDAAVEGARAWLDKVSDPDYGRVGYVQRGTGPARPQELVDRFPGDKSESMTAAGIFMRVLLGEDPRRSRIIKKGVQLMNRLRPVWNPSDGSIDMYYWYYGSNAMFQVGGDAWKTWSVHLRTAVAQTQRQDTDYCTYKGSWDPIGPWGLDGGRVYSTALLALCLETYSRYARRFGPAGD